MSATTTPIRNGPAPVPQRLRFAAILAIGISLSACGLKFVYNQLDWLIPLWVSSYISLNDIQETELDTRLQQVLHWHRVEELNAYAALIRQVQQYITDGLTETRLEAIFLAGEQRWLKLQQKVTPHIADILLTADNTQKLEMYEKFEEQNAEFRDQYFGLSEPERIDKSIDDMTGHFEDWLGDLNTHQITAIEQFSRAYLPLHEERYKLRLNNQIELRNILETTMPPEVFKNRISDLFLRQELFHPVGYPQKLAHNRKLLVSLITDILRARDPDQHNTLMRELNSYAQSFEQLAMQARPAS